MLNFKSTALTATLVVGLSSSLVFGALAHGGATGIVKERMDNMLGMAKALKVLVAVFNGERDYEAKAVRSAADAIATHSGENLLKLFPQHSLQEGSEARPEIWQDWSTFSAMANDLELYTLALSKNADQPGSSSQTSSMMGGGMMSGGMMGGSSGMMGGGMMGSAPGKPTPQMLEQMPPRALFGMVTQTCSSCHSRFRKEKK
jgi:cytochrome c556